MRCLGALEQTRNRCRCSKYLGVVRFFDIAVVDNVWLGDFLLFWKGSLEKEENLIVVVSDCEPGAGQPGQGI